MKKRSLIILILIFGLGFFIIKNLTIPKNTTLIKGRFQDCPKSPNCVCCCAKDQTHYIAPLPYTSVDVIEKYLKEHYSTSVITKTPTYLHVVITTKIMRFKDDVQFILDEKNKLICVRSSSRVGYSDMGENRKRIEKLREFLLSTANSTRSEYK